MSSRPSSFLLTNPAAYDGKAVVYTLRQLLGFPPPTWLIQNLVPSEAVTGLAGPPGVGKSMLALDWALCVATGLSWQGHSVDPGFALYIAAEGHSGLSIRAKAWLRREGISAQRARFGLVKGRLAIRGQSMDSNVDNEDYETLFQRIDDEIEECPKLVIIDTLARCIQGDENKNEDMTGFIDGAEQMIDRYKASVLVIHHKNAAGTRERGHTSFRGALGALFFLEAVPRHPHLLALHNEKQRDAAEHSLIGLELKAEGDSALLSPAVLPERKEPGTGLPTPMRKADMLSVLAVAEGGMTFTEWRLASQVPRRTFARRVTQLIKDGEIYKEENRYYVVPSVTDLAELDREEE
mgnify:CR=1 FL=1